MSPYVRLSITYIRSVLYSYSISKLKTERGMFIFYNTNLISTVMCCVYSLSSLLCWALPAVRVSPLDKVIMGQQGGQYEDRFIRGLIGTNRNRMSLQQAKFGARRQLPSPFSLGLWRAVLTLQHDVNALRWVVPTRCESEYLSYIILIMKTSFIYRTTKISRGRLYFWK